MNDLKEYIDLLIAIGFCILIVYSIPIIKKIINLIKKGVIK